MSSLRKHRRNDTVATFGFDRKEPPPALDLTAAKPRLQTWEANALKGQEQVGISTPFNILKDGSIHERDSKSSPFVSAEEQQHYQERGIYTPKTGAYVPSNAKPDGLTPPAALIPFAPRSAGSLSRDMSKAPNLTSPSTATPRTAGLTTSGSGNNEYASPYAKNRPSSDIFESSRSALPPIVPTTPMTIGQKTKEVHTSDLWLPPLPVADTTRTTVIQEPRTMRSPGLMAPMESSVAIRSIRASLVFAPLTPAVGPKGGPKTTNVSTSDLWPPPLPGIREVHPGSKVSDSLVSTSSYGSADYVYPKQANVSTADLWPPPNPDYERIEASQRSQLRSQIAAEKERVRERESKHSKKGSKDSAKDARKKAGGGVVDGNVPVRDSFMGFDNGR